MFRQAHFFEKSFIFFQCMLSICCSPPVASRQHFKSSICQVFQGVLGNFVRGILLGITVYPPVYNLFGVVCCRRLLRWIRWNAVHRQCIYNLFRLTHNLRPSLDKRHFVLFPFTDLSRFFPLKCKSPEKMYTHISKLHRFQISPWSCITSVQSKYTDGIAGILFCLVKNTLGTVGIGSHALKHYRGFRILD